MEIIKKNKPVKRKKECKHEYRTNYCNSDGSYSYTICDDCDEIIEL